MYKLKSYFMAVLAAGSVAFLTSCGGDDDDTVDPKPTLDFVAGSGFTSADANVTGGTPFTSKVSGRSNSSGTNLDKFKITVSYDNAAPVTVLDSAIGKEVFDYTYNGTSRTVAGTEKWTYTLTDRKSNSVTRSYTLTTTDPNTGNAINTFTAVMMGSQSNTSRGSFFSTQNGTVMLQSQAKNQSSLVDFVHYYGAINKATIAAPTESGAKDIFDNATTGIQTWGTQNATKFKEGLSNADFTGATTMANLDDAYSSASGAESDKASDLTTGDVVAFMTAGGKHGMFKVISASTSNGASSSMTIEVKVQK